MHPPHLKMIRDIPLNVNVIDFQWNTGSICPKLACDTKIHPKSAKSCPKWKTENRIWRVQTLSRLILNDSRLIPIGFMVTKTRFGSKSASWNRQKPPAGVIWTEFRSKSSIRMRASRESHCSVRSEISSRHKTYVNLLRFSIKNVRSEYPRTSSIFKFS